MKFFINRLSQSQCLIMLSILLIPVSGYSEVSQDSQSIYELVKQQQKMLEQQQKQIAELREIVLEQQEIVSQRLDKTEHKVKKIARSSSKFSVSKKGLRIKSKDGRFAFRAGGRIHVDYANYNDDKTNMGSGAELRRARVYFKGKFYGDWLYKAEIDFAENGKVGARGVWLAYKGFKPVSFKLGNFQEPFGLEEMNSSNVITFMERSLANAFAPSYHLGGGARVHGDFWSLSTGVFGESLGTKSDKVDSGWGIATRATIAPLLFGHKLLHLGFSNEYRQTDTDNNIRIRNRPESGVTNRRLVDTRTIDDVDHTWLVGGEIAAVYGPVSLQGEYIYNKVSRTTGNDLDFYGAYAQGSWFLTGESRPYNAKKGIFKSISPLHNYGAWEFAFRYSILDLNDQDIQGGREENFTLGLNWYANYNVRVMLNYIFVNAYPNRDGIDENPNILQMRGQLVF